MSPGGKRPAPSSADPNDGEVVELMGQALLVCMSSAARYWTRLGEVWASYYPKFAQALLETNGRNGASEDHARTVMEQVHGCLRELAELPAEEAQRLRGELERIAAALPRSGTDQRGPYWRRWDVKP